MSAPPVIRSSLTLRGALLAALAWGFLAALGQVAKIVRRFHINGEFAWASRDVFWMTPIANALYFCVVALIVWGVARLLKGRASDALVSGVLAGLCVFSVLIPFGGIHEYAVIALGVGVGVQYARMLRKGFPRLRRLVHGTGLAAGALLVSGGLIERQMRDRADGTGSEAAVSADRPNVVVIIWDTVRASNLSLYGYHRATTPELTRLAATSTTFDWAIAPAPWTLPSHCSMFTGRHPGEHGCGWVDPLPEGPTTVAEVFTRNGYRTGGFVANRFYATHETGLQRGFGTYQDFPTTLEQTLLSSSLSQLSISRDLITGGDLAKKT